MSIVWLILAFFNFNIEANNWAEVEEIVRGVAGNSLDKTLVCIDVDNVLTYTDHTCTYPHNVKDHHDFFDGMTIKEIDRAWGDIFMNNPQATIDKDAKDAIVRLQSSGATTIGLTSLVAGDDGEIMHKRNENLINHFGFKPSITEVSRGKDGGFYSACVTTDGSSSPKGNALNKLLTLLKKKLKTIVFIDDGEKNLENVRAALRDGYRYIAIHYVGFKKQIPNKKVSFEEFKRFWSKYIRGKSK